MPTHTTITGNTIDYQASRELAAYLDRLRALVEDPHVSNDAVIAFAYAPENPLLDAADWTRQGLVTARTLADPAYRVMGDLLVRKRATPADLEELRARHTMTVSAAAGELGISEAAVRKAIDAGRLSSAPRDGQHFLDPEAVRRLEVTTRGEKKSREPEKGSPLELRFGHAPGASLHVHTGLNIVPTAAADGNVHTGRLKEPWTALSVLTGGEVGDAKKYRYYLLKPSHEDCELKWRGFYVRGKFRIEKKENNAREARALFKATEVDGYSPGAVDV